eukprot:XP_011665806.1 PREDICTED: uncharacterized protein LOC105439021 [Strongylocentrotus purpuratus]
MNAAGQLQAAGGQSEVRQEDENQEKKQGNVLEVNPEDSVSQCVSHTSSASSAMLKAMSRKAALAAEAAAIEERQQLELEEFQLTQRKLRLSMQTKLRVAEAEEQIYLEFENKKLGISFPEKEQDETLPYTPGKVVTETVVPTKSTKRKPITADRSDHGQPLTMSDDSDVVTLLKEGQQEQRRLWEVMQLPKAELTPYDGNPLEFWEFWRSFEDNIDSSSCGDRTKLTRLLYYCRGEPKRRLSPCLLMNASQGYSTAKRLLIERFGDPVVITDSWMKKITSGKQIGPRDKKGLRELADDMSVCLMSFQAMGFEQELSPQKVLLPLAERLPFHLKGKWLSRVGAIRRQERIPRFEDLMYFVQEAAQEVNDPVYGELMSGQSEQRTPSRSGKSKGSFSTSSTAKPVELHVECFQCKGNHRLWDCKQFKDLPPKDRMRLARNKGLCFNCLRRGHMIGACSSKRTCSVDGCTRKHNKLLHMTEPDGGTQNRNVEQEASCSSTGAGRKSVLPIVPVRVKAEGCQVMLWTYALLDQGSTSTFCSASLARSLGAKGVKGKLLLTTLDRKESTVHTEAVSLVVDSGDNSKQIKMLCVYTKENINVKGVHMATVDDIEGDLCLERQLERFWKLETPDPFKEERAMSKNDVKALAEWEQGICIEEGHYQLPIPFKKRPPDLQNNRWLAERRLQSLGKRLSQSDGLLQKYTDGMADLLKKGYAEEVNELDSKKECEWYLPHHPVFHPQKPGKVRIVFDCASAWKGLSLNDVVNQGPDLTNKLIGVLLRFRTAPVALMADIEAMFHQVRVPAPDRDVLRFLWWPTGDLKEEPCVYRMCVHLFGGTWSPSCCSYALRRTDGDTVTINNQAGHKVLNPV